MHMDDKQLKELKSRARAMCGWQTMARWAGMSLADLKEQYGEIIETERQQTRYEIAKAQLEKALSGDNTMLIWLGKQHLSQSDKSQTEVSGKSEIRIMLTPGNNETPRQIEDAEIIAIGKPDDNN